MRSISLCPLSYSSFTWKQQSQYLDAVVPTVKYVEQLPISLIYFYKVLLYSLVFLWESLFGSCCPIGNIVSMTSLIILWWNHLLPARLFVRSNCCFWVIPLSSHSFLQRGPSHLTIRSSLLCRSHLEIPSSLTTFTENLGTLDIINNLCICNLTASSSVQFW